MMTTKQAINLLEPISYSQHDVEKQEALEMAIRALEGDGDMISRKMAIDAINNCYCGGEDSCGEPWIYEDDAIKAVEQLPSAQPERKKGKWIKISPANIYECSECGKNVMTDDISAYDFCHGCGADMRGDSDEN